MILCDKNIKTLCQPDNGVYRAYTEEPCSVAHTEDYKIVKHVPLVDDRKHPMITPFVDHQVKVEPDTDRKIVSYGVSSFGYDVRLAPVFKLFTNVNNGVIDPLDEKDITYVDIEADHCIVPPNSYVLGHTLETFNIPENVLVICMGKSTWARKGLSVNVTPLEPEFEGQVVIELANNTPLPIKVHANMGIAQFLFLLGTDRPEITYADRAGKYQNQTGIRTAQL